MQKEDLTLKVISDLETCKTLWEQFSPNKTLDDNWDFRLAFIKDLGFKLHFIAGFIGDNPIGTLPLQQNPNKGISQKILKAEKPFLEFFAGVDSDNNDVFILPEYQSLKGKFFEQIGEYAILSSLKDKISVNGKEAEHMLDKYRLDLKGINGFEDFLNLYFSGETKRNLIHRIRHMDKTHKIEIKKGGKEDLERLFNFSISRFGEDSSFNMGYRKQIYRQFYDKFENDLFIVLIDGEVKAVAFCLIYKGTYTLLNTGYDPEIRDVGKILVAEQINRAVKLGCKLYDAGQGDNGWKDRYHLQKIPQYKLTLN